MTEALALDVVLLVVLVGYLVYGVRRGLSGSIFVIAGVVVGVIAAFFLAPLVGGLVPFAMLRLPAVVACAVALIATGHAVSRAIGRSMRSGVAATPLGGADRLLGAVVTTVAAALAASVLAGSVGQLGIAPLSRAVAGSAVLRTIGALTPDPVESFLAQLRTTLTDRGLPALQGVLGPLPPAPAIDTGDPELNAAARSVVRITGTAVACGRSLAGSGFVVAPERVVTNAHVLAGVTEPIVESPDGQVLPGSVVYFDPVDDLAVIAVPGLTAAALPLSTALQAGDVAAVQGYPYGGPFVSGGARVVEVGIRGVADIAGTGSAPREIYTLAADVREGNSGGPLLNLDGQVAGVIFARGADVDGVGYAATNTELAPVAAQAPALAEPVGTGGCLTR